MQRDDPYRSGPDVTARRGGAPRLIDWTGERCVPWAPDVQVVYEHLHRYFWAAEMVSGRRVLDLGSGEGFGSAILEEQAESVVGIDADERTVEHSRLNYAAPGLSFSVGDAADLSVYADGSFDVVVAFEVIEHVAAQEQVLAEIDRVLSEDGLLIMSTPDRRAYSDATGQGNPNPFHVRELTLTEFRDLISERLPHVELWAQRTITGSHIGSLTHPASGDPSGASLDFFIERVGDDWKRTPDVSPLYLIAVASRAPFETPARFSTLADPGVELLRKVERDAAEAIHRLTAEHERAALRIAELARARRAGGSASREKALRVYAEDLAADLADARSELRAREENIAVLGDRIAALEAEQRRVAGSVSMQVVQRTSGAFYAVVGRRRWWLARCRRRCASAGGCSPGAAPNPRLRRPGLRTCAGGTEIRLPVFDQPEASLIIPCHARADLTLGALETIKANTMPVPYEVIIVDDDADPETKRLLERVSGAKVITNRTNLGYIRSMNRAAALARGRWLVLCNNDIGVSPGWLEALIRCGDSAPDIGIVTPRYIYPDESLNEAGGIVWRDGTGWNYGRGENPDRPRYTYRREVDYGSAAALLVRADFWRRAGRIRRALHADVLRGRRPLLRRPGTGAAGDVRTRVGRRPPRGGDGGNRHCRRPKAPSGGEPAEVRREVARAARCRPLPPRCGTGARGGAEAHRTERADRRLPRPDARP